MGEVTGRKRLCLKDLPPGERPQERLEKLGPRALSDRELLAMILRTGTANYDVLSLADYLIRQTGSLTGLVRWDVSDFQKIPGIERSKHYNYQCKLKWLIALPMARDWKNLLLMDPKKYGASFMRIRFPKA